MNMYLLFGIICESDILEIPDKIFWVTLGVIFWGLGVQIMPRRPAD